MSALETRQGRGQTSAGLGAVAERQQCVHGPSGRMRPVRTDMVPSSWRAVLIFVNLRSHVRRDPARTGMPGMEDVSA
jgi:hypothetical protein